MPTAHLAVVVARRSFATPVIPFTPVAPARKTEKTGDTSPQKLSGIFFNTREEGGAELLRGNTRFSHCSHLSHKKIAGIKKDTQE